MYDKRRDYNFDILGLPAFLSNIPNSMAYGIICSQFSRFANICMTDQDFLFNCQIVINKIRHNGFPSVLLKKYVNKFCYNKNRTIAKYNFDRNLIQHIDFYI